MQHPSRQEGAHWPCHLCLHHHRLFQCNILLDGKVLTDLAIFVYTTIVCFSATSFWTGRCSLTLPSLFTPPPSVSVQHPSRQEGAHWPCLLCLHHHRLFQCNILLDRKVLTDLAIFEPRTFQVYRHCSNLIIPRFGYTIYVIAWLFKMFQGFLLTKHEWLFYSHWCK